MIFKNYITSKNDRRLLGLSILLFLPVLLDFITTLRGKPDSGITMTIYAVVGIFLLGYSTRQIKIINIVAILLYWLFCFINYLSFPENATFYSESSFLLSSFFFFPISTVVIFRINDWSNFLRIFYPFSLASMLIGMYVVFFSDTVIQGSGEFFSYMEFSYGMLPSTLALYYLWRKNHEIMPMIAFFICMAEILSFGARASIFFALFFIISYECICTSVKRWKILGVVAVIFIIWLNVDFIVGKMLDSTYFANSRFLLHFASENLFESSNRDVITEMCINRINQMDLSYSGMFGDRAFIGNAVYPHNIVYEILMQYGWVIGITLFLFLIYIIIHDFFVKKHFIITLFSVCSLFGRYLISGSYLIEGKFWIFLFILLSIKVFCNKASRSSKL